MTNCIEIKGLCKSYGDFALNNINLNLPGGSILGLIGENGAGKTTTIKCILNLIRRDAGEITLLGYDNMKEEGPAKQDVGLVLDECFSTTASAPWTWAGCWPPPTGNGTRTCSAPIWTNSACRRKSSLRSSPGA